MSSRRRSRFFSRSVKSRAKEAKAGISNPADEDFNIKDTPEQSVAAPRHERQWGTASGFINEKISEEEFQQCVQQLIAAKCDKGSHIGASNVVQQAANTPTTMNFPVYPTEAVNMSGRRLSQIFFRRGICQREQDQHCCNIKRGTTARQDTNCIEFSRQYDRGLQRIHKWQDQR